MKMILLLIFVMACSQMVMAQDFQKLSPHLVTLVRQQGGGISAYNNHHRSVLTLMTVTSGQAALAVAADYGCHLVDRVGRVYIIDIPVSQITSM